VTPVPLPPVTHTLPPTHKATPKATPVATAAPVAESSQQLAFTGSDYRLAGLGVTALLVGAGMFFAGRKGRH
jgi:hypothetical protein